MDTGSTPVYSTLFCERERFMNHKKYHTIIGMAIITLLLSVFVTADITYASVTESDNAESIGRGEEYSAILYDNSNGLPTSESNAIAQTGDGFIWIGGYSGLIRYDGNDFYRYDASTGISSVVSLYVDSKDRLWVGTNDNGIALYENGTFRFFNRDHGLKSVSIRAISEDAEGNIIIATTEGIAYIDAQNKLHMLDNEQINEDYICEIEADKDGVIYGVNLDGDFFVIESLRVSAYYKGADFSFGVVTSISPNPVKKGEVYLGTEESKVICGDLVAGMNDYRIISVDPQATINSIYPTDGGIVWVCADNGIGYFDVKGNYTELPNLPMNNSVDDMLVDYEGNLWFSSSRQGVMKMAKSRFKDISKIAGLDNAVVNSTCVYQDDLYIGTDAGLYLLDSKYHLKENVMTDLLEGIRIRCIKTDGIGNIWLCSYGDNGLVCYHGDGTYTIYNTENGLASNRVRAMTVLSDGTIAVASSGGINLIRDEKVVATYKEEDGISNTEILTICEGDDGSIYAGSDGDGLYVVKGNDVKKIGVDRGLASEVVLRIKKDPIREVYWIITSNSISYMKDEQVTTVTNFPYSNNFDLYFDASGAIWILSSNGVYVVNGDDMLANESMEYTLYDSTCGLPCVATANSRSYLGENGDLYISGSSGVSLINMNDAGSADNKVRLAVPFIEADDEIITLSGDTTVTIPADCKRLTIYGYALTYALHNPRMSYYLEGFDDGAVSVSKQDMQPVSYTNLDGGKYTFRLSVINTMTGEEESTIAVTIIKEKAFYEYAAFWFAILFVMVLAVVFAVRIYTKHKTDELLEKQEENRTFINQIIHAFAKCIDLKDKYTNGHSFRVAKYAGMIAGKMGYDENATDNVYNIGLLHDIGKITIPGNILNKPGKLTAEEYDIIKKHASNGYDILKEIEISPDLALGAAYHHERIDGTGYPLGKAGDEIPTVAQIIAVADTFDAMNSTRPYRKQMPMEEIVEELKRVAGTQLNAEIVEVLLQLIEEGAIDQNNGVS